MSKKPSGSPLKALRQVNYGDAKRAFEKLGFVAERQVGSHIVMVKPGHVFHVTLPAHRPVKEGTLRNCIRAAGITPAEFLKLLD